MTVSRGVRLGRASVDSADARISLRGTQACGGPVGDLGDGDRERKKAACLGLRWELREGDLRLAPVHDRTPASHPGDRLLRGVDGPGLSRTNLFTIHEDGTAPRRSPSTRAGRATRSCSTTAGSSTRAARRPVPPCSRSTPMAPTSSVHRSPAPSVRQGWRARARTERSSSSSPIGGPARRARSSPCREPGAGRSAARWIGPPARDSIPLPLPDGSYLVAFHPAGAETYGITGSTRGPRSDRADVRRSRPGGPRPGCGRRAEPAGGSIERGGRARRSGRAVLSRQLPVRRRR